MSEELESMPPDTIIPEVEEEATQIETEYLVPELPEIYEMEEFVTEEVEPIPLDVAIPVMEEKIIQIEAEEGFTSEVEEWIELVEEKWTPTPDDPWPLPPGGIPEANY